MVRSGCEGRGLVTGVLTDIDVFGTGFARAVEFEVITEEGMEVDRDVGKRETGTYNCMLPPTHTGGGSDATWFVSTSKRGD
jgi:hypothetical protein